MESSVLTGILVTLYQSVNLLLLHGKLNQHFVALLYPCHKTTFPTRSDTLYIYIYLHCIIFQSNHSDYKGLMQNSST